MESNYDDDFNFINIIHFFDTIYCLNNFNNGNLYSLNEVKLEFVYNLIFFALQEEKYVLFYELECLMDDSGKDVNSPNIKMHKSSNFHNNNLNNCDKQSCEGLINCQNKLFYNCCLYPFRNIAKDQKVSLFHYIQNCENYTDVGGRSSNYAHFINNLENTNRLCDYHNWDEYFYTDNNQLKKCIFFYKLVYYFNIKKCCNAENYCTLIKKLVNDFKNFFQLDKSEIKNIIRIFNKAKTIKDLISTLINGYLPKPCFSSIF